MQTVAGRQVIARYRRGGKGGGGRHEGTQARRGGGAEGRGRRSPWGLGARAGAGGGGRQAMMRAGCWPRRSDAISRNSFIYVVLRASGGTRFRGLPINVVVETGYSIDTVAVVWDRRVPRCSDVVSTLFNNVGDRAITRAAGGPTFCLTCRFEPVRMKRPLLLRAATRVRPCLWRGSGKGTDDMAVVGRWRPLTCGFDSHRGRFPLGSGFRDDQRSAVAMGKCANTVPLIEEGLCLADDPTRAPPAYTTGLSIRPAVSRSGRVRRRRRIGGAGARTGRLL